MRAFTVIGPSQSGKSTVVEALAGLEGAKAQTLKLMGDASVTKFDFLGDRWAAFDIPGGQDNISLIGPALAASDAAVLCAPAEADAAVLSAPYLRILEESGVPAFLFVNKIDVGTDRISEIVSALQTYCSHGIALRQVPMRSGDEIVGALVCQRPHRTQGPLGPLPRKVTFSNCQVTSSRGCPRERRYHQSALLGQLLPQVRRKSVERSHRGKLCLRIVKWAPGGGAEHQLVVRQPPTDYPLEAAVACHLGRRQ